MARGAHALEPVPFVGCAGDGQMGPLAAKEGEPVKLDLTATEARRLAFYANAWNIGVLAPKSWRCFVAYGSDGAFLVVAPDFDVDKGLEATRDKDFLGSAVVLDLFNGGTSGRFSVAPFAARLFPKAAHDYIERVARDQDAVDHGDFRKTLRFKPFPADILTRKSALRIDFETPPWREGLGTSVFPRLYASSPEPIYGTAILSADTEWPDLLLLAVRLPRELQSLRTAIIRNVGSR